MQPPPDDPWFTVYPLVLTAASVATWCYLFVRWARRGCLLPYEPRRSVPWGPIAASLAVASVLLAVVSAATSGPSVPPPVIPNSLQAAERILGLMAFQLLVTGAALLLVVTFSGADLQDLGLPTYVSELLPDARIGLAACLAAVAPVFGLLLLMQFLAGRLKEPSHHPLVEIVTRDANFGIVLLASLAAVVVAPVCEEIVFRLLLQGWLEKWEDGRAGRRKCEATGDVEMTSHECRIANHDATNNECQTAHGEPAPLDDRPTSPERRRIFFLPHGWLPIAVSSLLFALAHYGYGPEPVPLFVLAVILGYVYQRTHRVVPCIVTHALFNLITVVTLWRLVSLSPE